MCLLFIINFTQSYIMDRLPIAIISQILSYIDNSYDDIIRRIHVYSNIIYNYKSFKYHINLSCRNITDDD